MTDDEKVRRAYARHQPGLLRKMTSEFRRLPDFLIPGAQKSGTTSLYRYLGAHPNVRFGRVKEVDYFDIYHASGERWYRAQFPLRMRTRGCLVGDASPYYLFHPHAAKRASDLVPHARLIVILRNPVDRAYSHYQHVVARGYEDLPFEDALEREARVIPAERQRILEDPRYRSLAHERYSYVSRGEYAEQLERWLRWFPREQVFVIASEQMFEDTNEAMAAVFAFLGLEALTIKAPERFKRGGYEATMPPETRARLVEHFRPHNARLGTLLARRFAWDS